MDENQHTLLIVDDEPFNLDILQEHLEDEGFNIVTASSGEQALDILLNAETTFSTILLDRMMPGMDGIEVLKKLKKEKQYQHIPVIMQTAAASDENVVEGLKAGAFYYLTKPFEPDLVVTVVKSALTDYRNFEISKEAINEVDELIPLITDLTLVYRTIDDAHRVVGRVSKMFPDPEKVLLGMSELAINAIEHGNLAISYDEKSELLKSNTWLEEIERRLNDERYKDRHATLKIIKKDTEIEFSIEDQGAGFDWQSYLEINAERAYDAHGRGIAMASMVSFDSITYNEVGNKVICIVKV